MADPLVAAIDAAIKGWWGTYDPRPTLAEAVALELEFVGNHRGRPTYALKEPK